MRYLIVLLIVLLTYSGLLAQVSILEKKEWTPFGGDRFGGLAAFNGWQYILINTTPVFSKIKNQSDEGKRISQKYPKWEIYLLAPDRSVSNWNYQWPVENASPFGFTILDENTVVFVNREFRLTSNQPGLSTLLGALLDKNYKFLFPYYDTGSHRLYFSSDLPGGAGGLDLWYIRKDGLGWARPANMGAPVNSASNEMSSLKINDTVMVVSSDRIKEKGADLFFFNLEQNKITTISPDLNGLDDELFVSYRDTNSIGLISRGDNRDRVWSVRWPNKQSEPVRLQEIEKPVLTQLKVEGVPEMIEKVESPDPDKQDDWSMTKYFGLAQYALTPVMRDSLDKIALQVNSDKTYSLLICGHASPDGPDYVNMMLSYYRANAAFDELVHKQVPAGQVSRIYGGEYLFRETRQARSFSLFSLKRSDLPPRLVVFKLKRNEDRNGLLRRFDVDPEDEAGWKNELTLYLPLADQRLVLIPIADLFFARKGDSVTLIAEKFNVPVELIRRVNALAHDEFIGNEVVYIPVH